jgi:glycerate kinase
VAACDVTNPLLGADGAALVYGPQKGATPAQARELDEHLRHLADVLQEQGAPDAAVLPGAGAAGGVGYALRLLGAEFHRGAELLLQLLDFPGHLAGTDLVITGEGSLDAQSLHGKAPVGVAAAACRAGVPVIAVVGRNALTGEQAAAAGLTQVYALADLEPDPVASQLRAAELVRATGRRIAAAWVAPPDPERPD